MQKALRSLELGYDGFDPQLTLPLTDAAAEKLAYELRWPGPDRILYVADAFRAGWTLQQVFDATKIDPWFLSQIEDLLREEALLQDQGFESLDHARLRSLKRKGFSDSRIATLVARDEPTIRNRRRKLGLHPVYKRVDTCAAEFATSTAYLYSTYEEECEANPTSRRKIMILGGGPNRIGQGIEFDYCCVHASMALREDGFETIMVNCNPETVSTDYDTSDRLYFEPLTFEDVMEIIEKEKPEGVIVQFGGQTPLKLSRALAAAGAPIIGTTPDSIDVAEDRERFQKLVATLKLKQPANATARTEEQAVLMAREVGFPLVVRPSYVLGGRAMEVVFNEDDLRQYMTDAVKVSNDSPVLLDRFLDLAIEVDVDAVSDGQNVLIGGIMEHIEQAGVHSGDSGCSLPPNGLSPEIQDELRLQTRKLAKALNVVGLMNIQFAIQSGVIYILEVNPRASRTVPFVSKATGIPLAKVAARVMTGKSLASSGADHGADPALLFGQGSGVPVRQVSRGRSDPGTGDEIHRRGHGHRPHLRRSLCQGAGRLGRHPADAGAVLRQRARPGQARGGAARADADRARLRNRGHRRYRAGPRAGRRRLPASQQGARGSPSRRRYDKKRRGGVDREHHRRQAGGARVALDSSRSGRQKGDLLHDRGRRARDLRCARSSGRYRSQSTAGFAQGAGLKRTPMTLRGAERLRQELKQLKSEARPNVIKAIAEARAHGDLSENAEYHAAREQQSFIEGRINDIENRLSNSEVIDVTKLSATGRVVFGATVELEDEDSGAKVTYQLVGDDEANIKEGLLSVSSPIARALIGKSQGDVVDATVPGGTRSYEIVSVRYV